MKKFNLWGFIFISFVCLIVVFALLTGEEKTTTDWATKPSRLRETRFYGDGDGDGDGDYDEYNCEDFETWKEAQEVFESSKGVENDTHQQNKKGARASLKLCLKLDRT